ncbi:MAG: PKD domain-containing protein [Acidobacteria bacterium]|nr:PKD domain-containing protein [Acidobacteriota bacterium]
MHTERLDELKRTASALALIGGPVVLLASDLAMREGRLSLRAVLGKIAEALFVPALFALYARTRQAGLGLVGLALSITGLLNVASVYTAESLRQALVAGAPELARGEFDRIFSGQFVEALMLPFPVLLFETGLILTGLALLRSGAVSRALSGVLIVAGVLFGIGHELGSLPLVLTADALFVLSLAPMGWTLLHESQKLAGASMVASAARGALAVLVGTAVASAVLGHSTARAQDSSDQARIQTGLKIAPVPLDLTGKDANLVGLGSYLVNVTSSCNDCHSASAQTAYVLGGIPWLGQHPAKVNPATYLGGGDDFGAYPDPSGPFPHIVSRNLTPDKSGVPVGGAAFSEFVQSMRNGVDPDKLHPTCMGPPDGKCLPAPFDGSLLQIMPWPAFQNLTDRDLLAIYEYLKAIPCVRGPNDPADRCEAPAKTSAVASPKNLTVTASSVQLDATASTSADGKPLTYAWTIPSGNPQAAILGGSTARPTIQFSRIRGQYTFQLTVTDAGGKSASDSVTINYQGN